MITILGWSGNKYATLLSPELSRQCSSTRWQSAGCTGSVGRANSSPLRDSSVHVDCVRLNYFCFLPCRLDVRKKYKTHPLSCSTRRHLAWKYKSFSFVCAHRSLTWLSLLLLIPCAALNEFDPLFNDSFMPSYIFKVHRQGRITLRRFMHCFISLQFPFLPGRGCGWECGWEIPGSLFTVLKLIQSGFLLNFSVLSAGFWIRTHFFPPD